VRDGLTVGHDKRKTLILHKNIAGRRGGNKRKDAGSSRLESRAKLSPAIGLQPHGVVSRRAARRIGCKALVFN
jgi:hypothetical protein